MSETFASSSRPVVWISQHETLPDSCVTCGMFTDHKVATRFVQVQSQTVATSESTGKVALGCLLHLLGPIGWILALILHSGDSDNKTAQKTIKTKSRVKVPICRLCAGQSVPQPVDGNTTTGQYAFEVHPRFADMLKSIRDQAEQYRKESERQR